MKAQKVWFITGASKGMGFEIAKAALQNGDQVVATARTNAQQLQSALPHNNNLLVVLLDVTDESQVKAGVQQAITRFGRIDVLVNNAGYGLLAATEEASAQEVQKQFDTNVFGLLHVTRAILPYMRQNKAGHIINISSLFGYGAIYPGFGIYGATKYAVEGISEGLALELSPFGIHVTSAAPGIFRTNFSTPESYQSPATLVDAYNVNVGAVRQAVSTLPGNEPGDPIKLAQVILRLAASDNPPLHLPIGKDAVDTFRAKTARTEKEVAEWESISLSTDFK